MVDGHAVPYPVTPTQDRLHVSKGRKKKTPRGRNSSCKLILHVTFGGTLFFLLKLFKDDKVVCTKCEDSEMEFEVQKLKGSW